MLIKSTVINFILTNLWSVWSVLLFTLEATAVHSGHLYFVMKAALLEKLADVDELVKSLFFFAILFIGRSRDWWSRLMHWYANDWAREWWHSFTANSGSGNEAYARAPTSTMIEICKTEPYALLYESDKQVCVHISVFVCAQTFSCESP